MGSHSSGQQWPYYRSLVGWFFPWMLIAAVVGIAVWVAIDFLGQGELEAPPPRERTAAADRASPSPTPSDSPRAQKTPEAKPEDQVKDRRIERKRKPRGDRSPALITEGVTVQVLNATASPGAASAMGERLESLGFEVVAVESASGSYPRTVVYWSFPAAQEAAEALADRYGWQATAKPTNLSATVDVHVVVGDDEV